MPPPLNLRPVSVLSPAPPHREPREADVPPWKFAYSGSKDGKQANLLVMFHGLGDTCTPFFNLGKQFSLPATCILSLQAPFPVPLMDSPSYTWHPLSPDDFLSDAPPQTSLQQITTHTLPLLARLFRYLVECGWEPERIHLFGWGQGGTTALEFARWVGLNGLQGRKRLGSAVSICGQLLSTPGVGETLALATPVLYFTRTRTPGNNAFLRRTFPESSTILGSAQGGQAMPRGVEEWGGVMKFWSGVLRRGDEQEWMRGAAGEAGEVYEVVT